MDIIPLLNTVIGVAIGSAIAPFIFYFMIKKVIVHDILKTINKELAKPENQKILKQIKEKIIIGMLGIEVNGDGSEEPSDQD